MVQGPYPWRARRYQGSRPTAMRTKKGLARTIREISTFEQGRNRSRHVIRIVDVFLPTCTDARLHLVFESLGLRLDEYRAFRGYDREDAQPAHHARRLILHFGRALDYLHRGLGLVHAAVSHACSIGREDPSSLSRGVWCRLGGFTSLEEASSFIIY